MQDGYLFLLFLICQLSLLATGSEKYTFVVVVFLGTL